MLKQVFGIREWDLSFLLSNYPCDWTDVCTCFNSSSLLLLCLSFSDTDTCTQKCRNTLGFSLNSHLANYSDLPNCKDHPKASYSECNIPSFLALWRDIQHAPPTPLIGQLSYKMSLFCLNTFLPAYLPGLWVLLIAVLPAVLVPGLEHSAAAGWAADGC